MEGLFGLLCLPLFCVMGIGFCVFWIGLLIYVIKHYKKLSEEKSRYIPSHVASTGTSYSSDSSLSNESSSSEGWRPEEIDAMIREYAWKDKIEREKEREIEKEHRQYEDERQQEEEDLRRNEQEEREREYWEEKKQQDDEYREEKYRQRYEDE